MRELTATVPCAAPPAWAVLERHLFALLDQSVDPYLKKYTRADGTLLWDHPSAHSEDDFYEAFYNWPLLYLLGGGDPLLELGVRQWEAVTRQLTGFGLVHREYARRDDQFHQAESDIYFYLLCLADPSRPAHRERARRFAGFYMDEDPEAPNYDPQKKLIRSPHNGSGGPSTAFFRGEPSYGWSPGMARYGLPHYDVPGIQSIEDLKDPALARRMGEYMQRRMSRGDVVANLAVASLVTNAYLLTGEEKYRQWVLDYIERLRQQSHCDWNRVFPFHTKEDAGHEPPWVRFLAGENPAYPESVLQAAVAQVHRRLELIRQDQEAATHRDVHRWQQVNPLTTEALIQLTLGAPQLIYNGGLLLCRLRYFDAARQRPGLPPDVAALVEKVEKQRTHVRLVNLSPFRERQVVVQAGAFGEHRFTVARHDALASEYPGEISAYAEPALRTRAQETRVDAAQFQVRLPPATQIALDLGTQLFADQPSYGMPV